MIGNIRELSSTSHRISHLYSNVDDVNNSSADEFQDEDVQSIDYLSEYNIQIPSLRGREVITPLSTVMDQLRALSDSYPMEFRLYLKYGCIREDNNQYVRHYVQLSASQCDDNGVVGRHDVHCNFLMSETEFETWRELSAFVGSNDRFIKFSFLHYNQSVHNEDEEIEDGWRHIEFRCLNGIMKAVERSTSIVHLVIQPYYHPRFHNILFHRFGKDKVTRSLTVFPHTYRYGRHDWLYNTVLSGCYDNRVSKLDISNGAIHPNDLGWLEAMYPRMRTMEGLKLLLPIECNVANLSIILYGPQSQVRSLDICFGGDITVEKFQQLAECVDSSQNLKELRLTIDPVLRGNVCDMLTGNSIEKCTVSFNDKLPMLEDINEINGQLVSNGINRYKMTAVNQYCFELTDIVLPYSSVHDAMHSNHRIILEVERCTLSRLYEANFLNTLVFKGQLTELECGLKKAAIASASRHSEASMIHAPRYCDFDAMLEMGAMDMSLNCEILATLVGSDGVVVKDEDTEEVIALDPMDAATAAFKIVRDIFVGCTFHVINTTSNTKRKAVEIAI
jgi:hypothetical protein